MLSLIEVSTFFEFSTSFEVWTESTLSLMDFIAFLNLEFFPSLLFSTFSFFMDSEVCSIFFIVGGTTFPCIIDSAISLFSSFILESLA